MIRSLWADPGSVWSSARPTWASFAANYPHLWKPHGTVEKASKCVCVCMCPLNAWVECTRSDLICYFILKASMPWIYSWMPAFTHFSVGLSSCAYPPGCHIRWSSVLWSTLIPSLNCPGKKKRKSCSYMATTRPLIFHLTSRLILESRECILQPDPVDTGGVGAACTPVQYVRRPKLWVVYWNPVVTAVQAHSEEKKPKRRDFSPLSVSFGLFAFMRLQMSKSGLFARILSLKASQCTPPRLRLHGQYPVCVCLVFCVYANDSQAHNEIKKKTVTPLQSAIDVMSHSSPLNSLILNFCKGEAFYWLLTLPHEAIKTISVCKTAI